MHKSLLPLLPLLVSCTSGVPYSTAADEERLLELHQAGLNAHMNNDVEAMLAGQADEFILVNFGEITTPTKDELRAFLGPYLATTRFEYYRDTVEPIVKVSRDGSLGWVIARMEVRGTSPAPSGNDITIEYEVAWIELYERRGEGWLAIGNASSFAPPE